MHDGGYDATVKDDALRDTLVFGLRSDRDKDAISLGNTVNLIKFTTG